MTEFLIPIKDLEISQRLMNVLKLNDIEFLNLFKNMTIRQVRRWRGMGHGSFKELQLTMSEHGINFLDSITSKNTSKQAIYETFINLDRRLENMEDSLNIFRMQISQTLAMFKPNE